MGTQWNLLIIDLCLYYLVLKRLVYNRWLNFINKFKILYQYHFEFRQKHPSFMALASFIAIETEHKDNKEHAIGVF